MRKVTLLGVLAVVALAASAQGALYYENFEDGLAGWSIWTERGTNTSAAVSEDPDVGDPNEPVLDNPNATMALVGGNSFNGGIYTTVSGLPTNTPLEIDGWWKPTSWPANNAWAEVIVIADDPPPPPQNGSDYNVAANLEYKTDSFNAGGLGAGGIGRMSLTAEVTNDGTFTTTTGQITIILKVGNGSGTTTCAFDDIIITPEPTAALLLGLPMLFLRRRRS